jgi:DNA-binding beta-propeller fold protein YncE
MFDARTFAILKKIDVQGNPDGYLNDAYNHRFYVLSHSEPNITVLDDKDGAILGTIDIGGAPEQAAADGHGKIYVDIEDKAAIAVIDANTMKTIGRYDISSRGGGCAGLALDAQNNILFASCRDKKNMIILSAADGHIITDLPIGDGSDGAAFNPATMEAFSSQGDGTLTVVRENSPTSFSVEQTVPTPARAKVLTLDTKTNQILTITAEYGPVPAAPAQAAGATPPAGGPPPRADDTALFPDTRDRQVIGDGMRDFRLRLQSPASGDGRAYRCTWRMSVQRPAAGKCDGSSCAAKRAVHGKRRRGALLERCTG